jgi:hypothetical protein
MRTLPAQCADPFSFYARVPGFTNDPIGAEIAARAARDYN